MPILESSVEHHVLAVDYGRSADRSALVLLRKGGAGELLVSTETFIGTPDDPVPVEVVENQIIEFYERFRVEWIAIDPFQMIGTAERLAKKFNLPLYNTEKADKSRFAERSCYGQLVPRT